MFVLFAGDRDSDLLVQRLCEHGKTVLAVGRRGSANARLADSCSEDGIWEDATPDVGLAAAVDVLARALIMLEQAPSSGQLVRRVSGQADDVGPGPSFEQARYGTETLSAFLALPHVQRAARTRKTGLRLGVKRVAPLHVAG